MENQHREIRGYRELTRSEIDLMNEIKVKAAEVRDLCEKLVDKDDELAPDQQWVYIGKTDLQKGFMALIRSISKPIYF